LRLDTRYASAAAFAAAALPPSGRSYVVIAVVSATYAVAAIGYTRVTLARRAALAAYANT